ncbi:zinc finger protein 184 [Copidosoma floridanum]|uniref:zinc finger protein 184 n=1 Tax=Copidosoma floridanum TaxID=29053 RepID=UPI0006C97FA8|nr:zinc finger protein 184 [Copidosoma floridanum]
MTLTCAGKFCTSTDNTKIDGRRIRFFELPSEKILRDAWAKLLKTSYGKNGGSTDAKKVLCELHFDKSCFDDDNQMKPNSVPRYSTTKKPPVNTKFSSAYDEPPTKKTKSDSALNNTLTKKNESSADKETSTKKIKPYRLTVQIDKIILKPGPKSKKYNDKIKISFVSPCITSEIVESLGQLVDLKDRQDLPAYNQCLVCKQVFMAPTALYDHLKEHFSCNVCKMEFTSRKSHGKHYKIHQSDSLELPFKCHVCNLLFVNHEVLSQHSHILNPVKIENKTYNCKDCNITFKNDITYRKHILIHKQESNASINKNEKPKVKTTLPAVSADEYICKICNAKFFSSAEIESHIKIHSSKKKEHPTTA